MDTDLAVRAQCTTSASAMSLKAAPGRLSRFCWMALHTAAVAPDEMAAYDTSTRNRCFGSMGGCACSVDT